MSATTLSKKQLHVILTITFGNILEWYSIYSYLYLAPILGKLFFNFHSSDSNLFMAFIIFGIGSITRPTGGLIFGRWGDLKGRKIPFVWSIFMTTMASFLMGCLPTYAVLGMWAPCFLIFIRVLQSLPESGEYVGAACFLYENSDLNNRKFMTSFTAVGNQIGAVIAIFEALVLDQFMSQDFLFSWGWRISFWIGGIIGLFGFWLRRTLEETPIFKEIISHSKVDPENFIKAITSHKQSILQGIAFGVINGSTFYLIAAYLPTYWETHGMSNYSNALHSITILCLATVLLPVFGILGTKYQNKHLLISSAVISILLLLPLHYSIISQAFTLSIAVAYLYILPITCITALLPSVILRLFKAPVRFTGLSMVFNLSDGVIGGFTPAVAILLIQYTGNPAAFFWFIFFCSIISLIYYFKVKE